jgi:hypothetical protein
MLPLGNHGIPKNRDEFERALRDGFAIFHPPDLRLEVRGEFPRFERVAVDFSGGTTPASPPEHAPSADGEQASLDIGEMELTALPFLVETGRVHLRLRASDVAMLMRGGGDSEAAAIELKAARSGEFTLETSRAELERIICAIAGRAARAQGVTIERTVLKLESTGPRSVKFCADVLAQKLFMHTAITLRGALSVDDQLNARLTEMDCSGGGIIGSLACGFLQPYIARLTRDAFPLAAFELGDVRVRDVALEVNEQGESVRVRAGFGNQPA